MTIHVVISVKIVEHFGLIKNLEIMEELINRIEHDIKQAEARRDECEKETREYGFNQGTVYALRTVLFDMRELNIIKS